MNLIKFSFDTGKSKGIHLNVKFILISFDWGNPYLSNINM